MSTPFLHRLPIVVAAMGIWCPGNAAASVISQIELMNGTDPAQPLHLADAAALRASLSTFQGRSDNAAVRESIADAVLQHYQSAGWPVVDVSVEKQARGVTRVHIEEGRYGEIAVAGGTENMRRAVFADWSRRRGAPLTSASISEGLAWLHRNPLRAATISFAPGTEPATADATLALQSDRAWEFSTGYRDDGSPPLDRDRFFARVEQADAFGVPSWWSVETSTAADYDEYHSATGALRFFLPSHHELRIGGYWTRVESTTALLPGFDSVSELDAWNFSLRWVAPLPAWRGWLTDVAGGADFFRIDSAVDAGGVGTAGRADTLHLAADIHATRSSGAWRSGVDAGLAWSPGDGITNAADDADHAALRNGASADYLLVRAGAWSEKTLVGGWTATGRVSGQWTNKPVQPTQEFSPAGAYGVRGFPASSVIGDSGMQGSVEIMTPALPMPDSLKNLHLKSAVFVDAAFTHDDVSDDDASIASAGAGLRLQWRESFGMAVDYGWRLTEPGGRLHVSLRMEF